MEPDKDKNVEEIVQKAMNASNIERTSINFTTNVMSKIEILDSQKIKYDPVISKQQWFIIAVSILGLIAGLYFWGTQNQTTYLDSLSNMVNIDFSIFDISSNYNIPDVFMYGILLFGLLFAVQIPLIKYYYLKSNNILDNKF